MIALAVLLAQAALPAPTPGTPQTGADDTFAKRCVFCHGEDGRGKTKKGKQYKAPNFTSDRWQKHTTDDEIVEAITNGVRKTKMPAFKDKLSADEIKAMVPFVRAFGAKK